MELDVDATVLPSTKLKFITPLLFTIYILKWLAIKSSKASQEKPRWWKSQLVYESAGYWDGSTEVAMVQSNINDNG